MLSTLTVVLQCCITNEGYGEDNDDIIESVLALLESCCVLEGIHITPDICQDKIDTYQK